MTKTKQATPAAVSRSLYIIANIIRDVANVDRNVQRLDAARDVKELAWQVSHFQTIGRSVLDNLQIVVTKLPARIFPEIDTPTTIEAFEAAPVNFQRLVGACDRFATFRAE